MVFGLEAAVGAAVWRGACAVGLGGEVYDLADLGAGGLEGVGELGGDGSDEDVDYEGDAVEGESAPVS